MAFYDSSGNVMTNPRYAGLSAAGAPMNYGAANSNDEWLRRVRASLALMHSGGGSGGAFGSDVSGADLRPNVAAVQQALNVDGTPAAPSAADLANQAAARAAAAASRGRGVATTTPPNPLVPGVVMPGGPAPGDPTPVPTIDTSKPPSFTAVQPIDTSKHAATATTGAPGSFPSGGLQAEYNNPLLNAYIGRNALDANAHDIDQ